MLMTILLWYQYSFIAALFIFVKFSLWKSGCIVQFQQHIRTEQLNEKKLQDKTEFMECVSICKVERKRRNCNNKTKKCAFERKTWFKPKTNTGRSSIYHEGKELDPGLSGRGRAFERKNVLVRDLFWAPL